MEHYRPAFVMQENNQKPIDYSHNPFADLSKQEMDGYIQSSWYKSSRSGEGKNDLIGMEVVVWKPKTP